MASVYPGALDSFVTSRADATVMATNQATDHNNYADAINKIEAEIGANTSRVVHNSRTQAGTTGAPTPTTVWTFQPVDTAKGPFRSVIGGASFNGTWDTVWLWGYNVSSGGGRHLNAEPAAFWAIEQDYEPSEGADHWIESYFTFFSTTGVTRRPLFWRFNRTTHVLDGFDIVHNGLSFQDWGNLAEIATMAAKSGAITILGHAAQTTDSFVNIVAQNSKLAYLQMSGTHGGFLLSSLASSQWAFAVAGTTSFQLSNNSAAFGSSDLGQSATLSSQTPTAQKDNNVTLKLKKVASQSTSLLSITDESNAFYTRVNHNGYFMTMKSAAPADAEIQTGELALWFDKTNGAAKLMIKAKETGGTVRTGSVALT